jgi:hypothetical protein
MSLVKLIQQFDSCGMPLSRDLPDSATSLCCTLNRRNSYQAGWCPDRVRNFWINCPRGFEHITLVRGTSNAFHF